MRAAAPTWACAPAPTLEATGSSLSRGHAWRCVTAASPPSRLVPDILSPSAGDRTTRAGLLCRDGNWVRARTPPSLLPPSRPCSCAAQCHGRIQVGVPRVSVRLGERRPGSCHPRRHCLPGRRASGRAAHLLQRRLPVRPLPFGSWGQAARALTSVSAFIRAGDTTAARFDLDTPTDLVRPLAWYTEAVCMRGHHAARSRMGWPAETWPPCRLGMHSQPAADAVAILECRVGKVGARLPPPRPHGAVMQLIRGAGCIDCVLCSGRGHSQRCTRRVRPRAPRHVPSRACGAAAAAANDRAGAGRAFSIPAAPPRAEDGRRGARTTASHPPRPGHRRLRADAPLQHGDCVTFQRSRCGRSSAGHW